MRSIIILLTLLLLANSKLIYLTELFRHGARYPVSDIYDGKQTKEYHGQLTSIGMRQQYLLGSYLKRDYIDKQQVFNGSLNDREVEIFTDSSDRCYQSAYAHAAGLFQVGQGRKVPDGIPSALLQPPFEVEASASLREEEDIFLPLLEEFALTKGYQPVPIKHETAYFPSCPNQANLIAKRFELIAKETALIELEQAIFAQKIQKMFGLSVALANIGGLIELYDVIVCDLNLGRSMPAQFTQKDLLQMKYVQNYMFVLLYAGELAKVTSTPLASAIIDKMEKVLAGKYDNKKLTIYSGHDTNVAPMLTFLNLTTADCVRRKYRNETVNGNCAEPVPFASSIQFELHQRDSSEGMQFASNHFVKIKYNGEYYRLCETNSFQCDFQEFSLRIKHQLVDYNRECGVK